jgi:hypothetical protein
MPLQEKNIFASKREFGTGTYHLSEILPAAHPSHNFKRVHCRASFFESEGLGIPFLDMFLVQRSVKLFFAPSKVPSYKQNLFFLIYMVAYQIRASRLSKARTASFNPRERPS